MKEGMKSGLRSIDKYIFGSDLEPNVFIDYQFYSGPTISFLKEKKLKKDEPATSSTDSDDHEDLESQMDELEILCEELEQIQRNKMSKFVEEQGLGKLEVGELTIE
eukprot:GHVP01054524.1.p1 GENE.GHVP01054524.1~~GHVP01054524.1.p1  ORF type:complete len:106 (+),score=24.77 GHVP01054524.1:275-592(+)